MQHQIVINAFKKEISMDWPTNFIESDHPKYLAIRDSGALSEGKLEFLSYLYRFHPCTANELIEKIRPERPDLGPSELMAFNKHPNDLKDNGTVRVKELRLCFIKGNLSQVLEPTFNLPCPRGMRVFAENYLVKDEGIQTNLSTVVFGALMGKSEPLAIKYCHHKNSDLRKRFEKEVEFMVKLQGHSEVVEILAYDLSHQPPYFVMPRASGGNLTSLLQRLRAESQLQRKVFNNLIDCIEVLHKEGILHRDIKPLNFLVFSEDDIKVIDFGIAREPADDTTTRMTVTGMQGGTEQFAPPEFFDPHGFKEADETWDTYSLGATFFSLLTGRTARFFVNHLNEIPGPIFEVLKKALSFQQGDRFQTMNELRIALNSAYEEAYANQAILGA